LMDNYWTPHFPRQYSATMDRDLLHPHGERWSQDLDLPLVAKAWVSTL
jgi:hypothetical protein